MNGLMPNRARKLDPPKSKVRNICKPLDYEHVLFLARTPDARRMTVRCRKYSTARVHGLKPFAGQLISWQRAELQQCVAIPRKKGTHLNLLSARQRPGILACPTSLGWDKPTDSHEPARRQIGVAAAP